MQNKKIVCIFAHPDDEAFGPGGTIAKWAKNNNVYLICVTDGSHPNGGVKELDKIRNKELKYSSKILGIKKVFQLNYCDGDLRNNIYHQVAMDIKNILNNLKPDILMTFDPNGVSGHIDHMFVTAVTNFVAKNISTVKKIYYFANQIEISNQMENYFIYFPKGYKRQEIDHIEDVSKSWKIKVKALKAHVSQKSDGVMFLNILEKLPKEEFFLVKNI